MTMAEQTPAQLREHYEIEKELATRLRKAPRAERLGLYAKLYDELFRRVPHHSQLTRKISDSEKGFFVGHQLKLLRGYLVPGRTFVEIGPGDCSLSLAAAKIAKQVIAVDVSAEITRQISVPGNFRLALSDGTSIPVDAGTADLAYSTDMIEHLHPEDAGEHMRNVHAALAPGGVYICVTPGALCGPWDISMGFDPEPTGFHLKEYRIGELAALFRLAGFTGLRLLLGARGRYISAPLFPSMLLESLVGRFPRPFRKKIAWWLGPFCLRYIRMAGRK